jgi:hypothetical protein
MLMQDLHFLYELSLLNLLSMLEETVFYRPEAGD